MDEHMDLMGLLRIVRRWLWVVVLVMLLTGAGLGYKLSRTPPSYAGTAKLQITAPPPADVELYSTYRSTNLRDDITVARNNFIELLQSREVYVRTVKQLDIKGTDARFEISTDASGDSDFLFVTVQARTPKLAEDIANTIVDMAITYYGEVRAKSMTASANSLRTQLANSEKQVRSAEQDKADFEREHNIGALDTEIGVANTVLQQLLTQRNGLIAAGKPTTAVDNLISAQRDTIRNLEDLQPDYSVLQQNVQQAQASYQLLLSKYQEAALKEDNVRAASFIQVVEPALAPDGPTPVKLQTLVILWLAGSLALGVVIALGLEVLLGRRVARRFGSRWRVPEAADERVPVGVGVSKKEERPAKATAARWFT